MSKRGNSEILRNSLQNFKSFQDSQIDALNNIAKSMDVNLEASNQLRDSLITISESMNSMFNKERNLSKEKSDYEYQMRKRAEQLEEELSNRKKRLIKSEEEAIANALNKINEDIDEVEFDKLKKEIDSMIDAEEKKVRSSEKFSTALKEAGTRVLKFATQIAEASNRYSELSNNLIKYTGASGKDVRDTRSEIIHGVVSSLNAQTGNYFNGEKAYQTIIEATNAANIGNLEAIQEMSRPILLASETMNGSTNELTKLVGKWYTRYNFSSMEMESMVDEIRGNTANNNATDEAVMRNMDTLNNWIAYYSKGDTTKMSEWSASISKGTAWLESMNVDSSRYTDYILKLLSGELNDPMLNILSNYAGTSTIGLQDMAMSGDLDNLYEILLNAESAMFGATMDDKRVKKLVADAFGTDLEKSVDAFTAVNYNDNYKSLNEFIESTTDTQSAVESIDDKYTTGVNKLQNFISLFTEFTANWQEKMESVVGLGFSDLITIGLSIATISKLGSLTKGGLGGIGGGGALASGGSKLLGALEMGRFTATRAALTGAPAIAAGAGIGLAGLGGLAYGITSGINDIQKGNVGLGAAEIGGGVAMGAGSAALLFGAANAWNPIGWAALIGGGLTLAGTAIYKHAKAVDGTADNIKKVYDSAKKKYKDNIEDQKYSLSLISANLKESGDAQKAATDLINSGLLSEKDIQEARKLAEENNIDALLKLTEAYKKATGDFAPEYNVLMDDAKDLDIDYQKKIKEGFVQALQGEGAVNSVDDVSNALRHAKYELESKDSSELNKADKALLKVLQKYSEDGYTAEEINKIMNTKYGKILGFGGHNAFKGSSLSIDTLEDMAYMFEDKTADITAGAMRYNNAEYVGSTLEEVNRYIKTGNTDSAVALMNKLKEEGYSSKDKGTSKGYSQIEELCKELGIPSFNVGTNYVEHDQLAYIHRGEAIVPEKYNPNANSTELEMLRKHYRDSSEESNKELKGAIKEFNETLSEIKEFLEYWRDDNIRREAAKSRVSRLSQSLNSISAYNMI